MKISRALNDGHLTTTADTPMVAVLADQFSVVYEDGRASQPASVRLTDNYLSFRFTQLSDNVTTSCATDAQSPDTAAAIIDNSKLVQLAIVDIIGCHVMRKQPSSCHHGNDADTNNATTVANGDTINNDDVDNVDASKKQLSYLCLYAYPARHRSRLGLMRHVKRGRKTLIFAINKHDTWAENFAVADQWRKAILWLRQDKSRIVSTTPTIAINIPMEPPRVRKLLIMINPASGPGKALAIFTQRVAPVLAESGLQFEVLVTNGAGNATNYVKTASDMMLRWDGIVIVSGDGLLYEVFNGIMQRDDWREAIKMPIGIIPGGSGNGLAHSINYAVGDRTSCSAILASALNVAIGRALPMDLIKVSTATTTHYSFLSVGWGLVADIDIESERLRIVGGARFTIWALVRCFSLRKYRGKLSYLPLAGYENAQESNGVIKTTASSKSTQPLRELNQSAIDGNVDVSLEEPMDTSCQPQSQPDRLRPIVPPLGEPLTADWVTIDSEFVVVYSGHQTHLSADCLFAPKAKLDDGIIWLLYVTGDVSRAQVLSFLTALDSGNHVNLPFVHMVPVHAFRLEPESPDGRVTIDGELIDTGVGGDNDNSRHCCPVQCEVLPSIARIMSRGN